VSIQLDHGWTRINLTGPLAATTIFWTAAGSEAPRRFWKQPAVRKAVSPLRSATAVQIFVVRARSCRIVLRIKTRAKGLFSEGKASLIGELVCLAEFLFLSVFICVHPWLKDFSTAWIRLELPRPLRLATTSRRNKLLPERSLLYQFPETISAMGRAALLRRRV
jgi:hypothetical protein